MPSIRQIRLQSVSRLSGAGIEVIATSGDATVASIAGDVFVASEAGEVSINAANNENVVISTSGTGEARVTGKLAAQGNVALGDGGVADTIGIYGVAGVTRPQVTASGVSAATLLTALASTGIVESV